MVLKDTSASAFIRSLMYIRKDPSFNFDNLVPPFFDISDLIPRLSSPFRSMVAGSAALPVGGKLFTIITIPHPSGLGSPEDASLGFLGIPYGRNELASAAKQPSKPLVGLGITGMVGSWFGAASKIWSGFGPDSSIAEQKTLREEEEEVKDFYKVVIDTGINGSFVHHHSVVHPASDRFSCLV